MFNSVITSSFQVPCEDLYSNVNIQSIPTHHVHQLPTLDLNLFCNSLINFDSLLFASASHKSWVQNHQCQQILFIINFCYNTIRANKDVVRHPTENIIHLSIIISGINIWIDPTICIWDLYVHNANKYTLIICCIL